MKNNNNDTILCLALILCLLHSDDANYHPTLPSDVLGLLHCPRTCDSVSQSDVTASVTLRLSIGTHPGTCVPFTRPMTPQF